MENFSKNLKKHEKNQQKHANFSKNEENFNKNDINFKKSLGQNFLFDTNLLNAIVADGDVESEDVVLEIGAGAGTLTKALVSKAKKVISFEIDESLKPILNQREKECSNIEFHFQDFMNAEIEGLFEGKARVVANIPYYITTPIVFKLVEHIEKFKSIMVLVQKEVAERFASRENTKEYGITSVILQSIFTVSIPRVVRKECFTPPPKVDSALCKLVPHNKYKIANFKEFKDFVHLAFSMRRKTLVNNLKSKFNKEEIISSLNKFGYLETTRPEQISVENFIEIYKNLIK